MPLKCRRCGVAVNVLMEVKTADEVIGYREKCHCVTKERMMINPKITARKFLRYSFHDIEWDYERLTHAEKQLASREEFQVLEYWVKNPPADEPTFSVPERDLKYWAQMALAVQNAVNLSGVVRSYADFMLWLYCNPDQRGGEYNSTDALNQHPLSRLFAAQVLWLSTGTIFPADLYAIAYKWAVAQTKED